MATRMDYWTSLLFSVKLNLVAHTAFNEFSGEAGFRNGHNIPGFGVAILSTSQGIMTHISAKVKGVGGEVICEVA